MLNYIFDLSKHVVTSRKFRIEVIELVISHFTSEMLKQHELQASEYDILSQCYFYLNRPEPVKDLLWALLSSNEQSKLLLAY